MNGNKKTPQQQPVGKPARKPVPDDLYEDGDMATPKRDFDEEDVKREEDKRM